MMSKRLNKLCVTQRLPAAAATARDWTGRAVGLQLPAETNAAFDATRKPPADCRVDPAAFLAEGR